MALSTLPPPRRAPPKTVPSKLKVRAMCNAIDQYFEYNHNQCPVKLRRFRSIEPQSKGRLGGWKTYERLQLASETVGFFGGKEEEEFWVNEINMKFAEEFEEEESEEEDEEEEEEEEEERKTDAKKA